MNIVDLAQLTPEQMKRLLDHARTWWPELVDFISGTELNPGNYREARIGKLAIAVDPEILNPENPKQLRLRLVRK